MAEKSPASSPWAARRDLFLISLLILFMELACIRWFPAHVLFLTFFTNVVLLACFLGMSLGCLAANRSQNLLAWTPFFLAVVVGLGLVVERIQRLIQRTVDVGGQASPQLVFFGTEYNLRMPKEFQLPIEVICGIFFLLLVLAFIGPGQQLGRCLNAVPNRILAYTINIAGSLVGIVLFAGFSWLELSPLWWFLPVTLGVAYFLWDGLWSLRVALGWPLLVLVVVAASYRTGTSTVNTDGGPRTMHHYWSPYYRVDYYPDLALIAANLIGHQNMVSVGAVASAYALPYLVRRDANALAGRPAALERVLIIGAGSGNDVARALQFGAREVDAVEIDPRIQALGAEHHPDRPYQQTDRVRYHNDDGRNFLRSAPDAAYDLIVFALVDSLVLHSGYSNLRLESYLFTREAFADVRRCLKPGGLFVMYNFFRQGWIMARLEKTLSETFHEPPLVMLLPHQPEVPEGYYDGFTLFLAGSHEALAPLRRAFAQQPLYRLRRQEAPGPHSLNGFTVKPEDASLWAVFGLSTIRPPENLQLATDDWPFLYLREPMIPLQPTLSGMGVMAGIAAALLLLFMPRMEGRWLFDGCMFFLGAGFMLIETKAVVHMALLFGSTWIVNSVVFFAVLVMILLANLYALSVRPQRLWPYYVGLLVALGLNVAIPLNSFLGYERNVQVLLSCLLVFAPILFAGIIFAVAFSRTASADVAFGWNIAGAMLGGLAENASMLWGFRYLLLVAVAFYLLAGLWGWGMGRAAARGGA
ncbi:MAG: methyltransferase domain-containing protein, partial [Gemmataceae bacterium]|nr:methyltransferase domain-containing protein [Gemmataceae bacterium]MDW8266095.1 methyltransferase domain-containing protein [Gemmataceae bacterium]